MKELEVERVHIEEEIRYHTESLWRAADEHTRNHHEVYLKILKDRLELNDQGKVTSTVGSYE